MEVVNAVGRRKTAVARVYLNEGKGNITINKKSLEEYFTLPTFLLLPIRIRKFYIRVGPI